MDELLGAPIPTESDATCDDCAMCAENGDQKQASGIFFDPHVKCCSYVPKLPNYLVGRVFSDETTGTEAGRASMAKRVETGVGVTPLGLDQPLAFKLMYDRAGSTAFGQSSTLICPHFVDEDGGRCGIWAHRGVVCATWFCKFVRGATGRDFWADLKNLLSAVERTLCYWCVLQLDVESETLRRLVSPSIPMDGPALDGIADPVAYRALWGTWLGREKEFYQDCARLVEALCWQDIVSIGGSELKLRAQVAKDAYHKLTSDELPARLKLGPFQIVKMDQDSSSVVSYSQIDPLELPRALLEVLPYFDGRPTHQAIADVSAAEGLNLHPQLILKLTDFGLLVPFDGSTPETTQQRS
jgi:hypothetical protein